MRRALPVLAALALLGAGCGSSGDDPTLTSTKKPAPAGTDFARALASTADTSEGRTAVAWDATAKLRALGSRWRQLQGSGAGRLQPVARVLPSVTGIDPAAATESTEIGVPPRTAVRLTASPLPADEIKRKLKAAGAKPRASTGDGPELLAVAPEGKILLTGPLGRLGLVNALNRVGLSESAVAAGAFDEPVLALLRPGDRHLLDAPGVRDVTSCLGPVVAARLASGDALDVTAGGATLAGVGVERPASAAAASRERLCVAAKDPAKLRARLEQATAPTALEPRTQQRLSTFFTSRTVRVDGAVVQVRFTLRPERPPGLLPQMLDGGTVATWLGGGRGTPPPGSGP